MAAIAEPQQSTEAEVTQAIDDVASKVDEWAGLGAARKLELLKQIVEEFKLRYHEWARASAAGHGYEFDNPQHAHLVAECYLKGPAMGASWLGSIVTLYTSLVETGKPPAPVAVEQRPDGSHAVTTFPAGLRQKVFSGGATLSVIVPKETKVGQHNPLEKKGGVTGVLAAGNFDAPIDILDALFMENNVVVVKPNPVNHHSAPVIAKIFKPLVDAGYLRFIFGAGKQGALLVNSPKVQNLLMTGSCKTYDRIVWGDDEKKAGKPKINKPFRAELGSVNPYVIVPGREWTDKEIDAHAEALVCAKMLNNAHICASPQVLITCKNWPQRQKFLDRVRHFLKLYPGTRPYYPMCQESYKKQLDEITKGDEKLSESVVVKNEALFPNAQHPIFATGVKEDDFVVKEEAFCPVLSETSLDTPATADAFLPAAVEFVNNKTWGSLTGTVIIDDDTAKQYSAVFEKALDELEVGALGVNQMGGFCVLYGQALWGAYPKHTVQDVRSGLGKIGNTFCLDGPVKAVLRAPFMFPSMQKVPVKRSAALLQTTRLTEFMLHDNTWRLVKLLSAALFGL